MRNEAGGATVETATAQRDSGALADEAFAALLLRALVAMAARSKRQQADMTAALRGAGLMATPVRVRAALRLLRQQGCIANLVPLSDGGLLLSVTPSAIDQLGGRPQWLPLDEED
jgi:hypothetical protein